MGGRNGEAGRVLGRGGVRARWRRLSGRENGRGARGKDGERRGGRDAGKSAESRGKLGWVGMGVGCYELYLQTPELTS